MRGIGPLHRAKLVRRWARLTPVQRLAASLVYAWRTRPVLGELLVGLAAVAVVAYGLYGWLS